MVTFHVVMFTVLKNAKSNPNIIAHLVLLIHPSSDTSFKNIVN